MSGISEKNSGTDTSGYKVLPVGDMVSPLPEAAYKIKKVPKYPQSEVANVTYQYARRYYTSDNYAKPEYNLAEIAKAEQTDSYVMRAFLKHVSLMLKGGWYLDGRNEDSVAYIYQRITELQYNTGKSFSEILRELLSGLVSYCNSFLVFVREEYRSSGKRVTRYGTDLAPIAGIFPADPTTMSAKTDDSGRVKGWRQNPEAYSEESRYYYAKHSIIHFHYNKKPGFILGTPWILPALDDIRAWRKLEELSQVLASRYTFPLMHYTIGSDQFPAAEFDQGPSEVADARDKVKNLPADGVLITSHRHKIVAVGLEGSTMNLEPYLSYWESRVIAGLNLSSVDLGKGNTANRSTAMQMSKSLADFCTDMRNFFAETIETQLFDVLLEEGGFVPNKSNQVTLEFPVIDEIVFLELEKHHQYMFQNNTITEDEMRRRVGQQPINESMRKGMYFELYAMRSMEESAKLDIKVAKATPAGPTAGSTSTKSPAKSGQAAKNKSENVNRPTNQEGKLPAKTRPVRDAVHKEWYSITESGTAAVPSFIDKCIDIISPELVDIIKKGLDEAAKYIDRKPEYVGKNMRDRFFNDCLKPKLQEVGEHVRGNPNTVHLSSSLGVTLTLLDKVLDDAETAAFNLGVVYGAQLGGADSVTWKKADDDTVLMPKTITFDALLPMVENDSLVMGFPEGTKNVMSDEEFAEWNIGNYLLDTASIEDGVDYLDLVRHMGTLEDKKLTTKQRKSLKKETFCGPDRSFPVNDCAHYTAALRLLSRYKGPGDKSKIRSCISRRGKKLGCPGATEK